MQNFPRRQALGLGAAGIAGLLTWASSTPRAHGVGIGDPLPEFQGIEAWLNSDPLTVEELKGQVVAVKFWTFACINCIRTLPHVTRLYDDFADQGFTLVGVHTPEFSFERDLNNIREAIEKHSINFPVAVDNRYQTWRAYENRYWPHIFIADQQGKIRYHHIGEGAYETTRLTVQTLLKV